MRGAPAPRSMAPVVTHRPPPPPPPRPAAPRPAAADAPPQAERVRASLEDGVAGDGLGPDGRPDDEATRARAKLLLGLDGPALRTAFDAVSDAALDAFAHRLEPPAGLGRGLGAGERADVHVHLARWLDDAASARWQAALPTHGADGYARFAALHRAGPGPVAGTAAGPAAGASALASPGAATLLRAGTAAPVTAELLNADAGRGAGARAGAPVSAPAPAATPSGADLWARLDTSPRAASVGQSATAAPARSAHGTDAELLGARERFDGRVGARPERLEAALRLALGAKADSVEGRALVASLAAGEASMPALRFVEPGALGPGALGAYDAAGGGTVLLDGSLRGDAARLDAVVAEELGHHFDALLGGPDAAGDEGAIFAQALYGEAPAGAALAALRAENDRGTVIVDGRAVAVEFDREDAPPELVEAGTDGTGDPVDAGDPAPPSTAVAPTSGTDAAPDASDASSATAPAAAGPDPAPPAPEPAPDAESAPNPVDVPGTPERAAAWTGWIEALSPGETDAMHARVAREEAELAVRLGRAEGLLRGTSGDVERAASFFGAQLSSLTREAWMFDHALRSAGIDSPLEQPFERDGTYALDAVVGWGRTLLDHTATMGERVLLATPGTPERDAAIAGWIETLAPGHSDALHARVARAEASLAARLARAEALLEGAGGDVDRTEAIFASQMPAFTREVRDLHQVLDAARGLDSPLEGRVESDGDYRLDVLIERGRALLDHVEAMGARAERVAPETIEALRDERHALYRGAVDALDAPMSSREALGLADALVDVAVKRLRLREGLIEHRELADALDRTNELFRAATGERLIGPTRDGQLSHTYTRSTAPQWMLRGANSEELARGEWTKTVGLSRTDARIVGSYAARMHEALLQRSGVRDLDYAAGANGAATGIDVQAPIDRLARLSRSGFDPSDEDSSDFQAFAAGLETVVARQNEAREDSESDWLEAADANYDLAALLLTGNPDALTQRDFRTVHKWVAADSWSDLGLRRTERVDDEINGGQKTVSLGAYGSFGRAKYEFAESVLNSDKSQRLRTFGIDETAWNRAEGFIAAGNAARSRANAIDRARFGFDDVVKIGIGAAFVYTGIGAAGAFAPGTFLAGGITGTGAGAAVGTGIGAGMTGFGLNFMLTGDIKASFEAGAVAGLTAGVGAYAERFEGATRGIVQAIGRGAIEEISGGDFIDGVVASVSEHIDEDVAALLEDRASPFVAGLAGLVVEASVRGDLSDLDGLLENYVADYLAGSAADKLTEAVGEESALFAGALAGVGRRVIVRGSFDADALIRDLQGGLMTALGNEAGRRVMNHFGGEDSFRATLMGEVTNMLIVTGGDADRMRDGLEAIGLDMAARYASDLVTGGLTGDGEAPGALALAAGQLVRIGIGSGFDATTMRSYAFGAVLDQLVAAGGDALTSGFGGTGRFMAGLLDELVRSFEANGGDIRAIARDLALWTAETAAAGPEEAAGGTGTNGPGGPGGSTAPSALRAVLSDTLRGAGRATAGVGGVSAGSSLIANARPKPGDDGTEVRAVENRLDYLEYDPSGGAGAPDDEYDHRTARAVASFVEDQKGRLARLAAAYEAHSPNSAEAATVVRAHAALAGEAADGVFGTWTAALLASPLTEDTVGAIEGALDRVEAFDEVETETAGPLREGMEGERVERLQERLRVHGYSSSDARGRFGDGTAAMLQMFHTGALARLDAALGSSGLEPRERHVLEDERKALMLDDGADAAGRATLAALAREPEREIGPAVTGPAPGSAYVYGGAPLRMDADAAPSEAVAALQQRLIDLDHDVGAAGADGRFGEATREAVQDFQDVQLGLLNGAIERVADAPEDRRGLLTALRAELVPERSQGSVERLTGMLLETPLDAAAIDEIVDGLNAPPTLDEVRYYLTSLEGGSASADPPDAGFMTVVRGGLFESIADLDDVGKLRKVLEWASYVEDGPEASELNGILTKEVNLRALGRGLDRLRATEIDDFAELLAPVLNAEKLGWMFEEASDTTRIAIVRSVGMVADERTQRKFAEVAKRYLLETDSGFAEALDDNGMLGARDRALILDLGQLVLDLAGLISPSPAADAFNALISAFRGNWLDVGISMRSVLPWIGDMAKLGKLGAWAQTAERVAGEIGRGNPVFQAARPVLETIVELVDMIPAGLRREIDAEGLLGDMVDKIKEGLTPADPGTPRPSYGRNAFEWTLDDRGRPTQVRGRILETFPAPRSSAESALATRIGNESTVAGDVGGHLIGHQFLGADSGRFNIVQQNGALDGEMVGPNLNQGAYKAMENEMADWAGHGMEVRFDVRITGYTNGRPDAFVVDWRVVDPDSGILVHKNNKTFANAAGQTLDDRVRAANMQAMIDERTGRSG